MVISPYIFSKVKREPFFSDASLGDQLALEITPKAFEPVYMGSFAVAVFSFAVFNDSVNIAFGGDSGVDSQGVAEDSGTSFYPCVYEGNKRFSFYVWNHFSPDLAASAKDAEHGSLCRPSASFRAAEPNGLPLVPPLASEIGLVNLYEAAEDLRDILGHCRPYQQQSPQNTLPVEPCFSSRCMAGKTFQKRHRYASPLRCRKSKGKTAGLPLVFATSATTLFPSNDVGFRKFATRTFMPFCHATYVS